MRGGAAGRVYARAAMPDPRRPPWKTRAFVLLALGVALGACALGPVLPGERTLVFRDALPFSAANNAVLREALLTGRLPEWNRTQMTGFPFLAVPLSRALYPPSWAAVLLTRDPATANEVVVAFHLLLLLLGGYAAGRELGLTRAGSAAVGFVCLLAGPNLSILENLLARTAWVPLGLAALLRLRRDPRPPTLAAAALALAGCVYSGAVQPVAWLASIAALLWLAPSWAGTARPGRVRLGWFVALGSLSVAASAALLLPALSLAGETTRGQQAFAEATRWSFDPRRLVELLLPFPFGLPFPERDEYLGKAFAGEAGALWIHTAHLGAIPLLCALRALGPLPARLRRARALGLALVVAGLLLAFGEHTPLYGLLARTPYAVFRYPEKHLALFVLGGALLAGVGLEAFTLTARSRRLALWLLLPALTLLLVLPLQAWDRAMAADLARRVPADLFAQAVGTALQQVAFLALVAWLPASGASRRACALAVLLGLAGLPVARRLIFTGPRDLVLVPPPVVSALLPRVRGPLPPRVFRRTFRLEHIPNARLSTGEAGAALGVATLNGASTALYGLEGFHGFAGVESWRYVRMLRLPDAPARGSAAFVLGPVGEGGQDLGLGLALRVVPARPRVEVLTDVRWVPDAAAAFAALERADLSEVVAEGEGSELPPGSPARPAGAVTAARRPVPERLDLDLEVQSPALLVVRDAWSPGWSAEVDGAPRPLLHVDGLFMGLRVTPTDHHVRFLYRTPCLRPGLLLSALALALAAIAARPARAST